MSINSISVVACYTLLFVYGAQPCSATILFAQTFPAEPTDRDLSTVGTRKAADDFVLDATGPTTVRSLRLIGGYRPDATDVTDDFRVLFYDDNDLSPGAVLPGGDFPVGTPTTRVARDAPPVLGFALYDYQIDLGEGIELEQGERYWITVVNSLPDSGYWVWASASGVFEGLALTTDPLDVADWSVVRDRDGVWFELSSTNVVPEPCSLVVILVGCVFMRSAGRVMLGDDRITLY